MRRAINAYHSITASSRFREVERLRDRARHDEAQALYHARQEGIQEGEQRGDRKRQLKFAQKLFQLGEPAEKIAELVELPLCEIEALLADWAQSE